MGPMRSGTTLLMQWLAATGLVAYPTNLLSRFYHAPIIGAKIQCLLTDPRYNFRDELGEFIQQSEFKSENGKTKGVLAPNEFWYFWRRFLSNSRRDVWSNEELRQSMDTATLKSELSGIMNVFQKPFAAKGMLFNYNIDFLNSIFDKILFVHLKRDLATNATSVLAARKRQLGSENEWYSFDIPEKEELMKLPPFEQVVNQIQAINKAVEIGLRGVDESRKLIVEYEDFCQSPEKYFKELIRKVGLVDAAYLGPDKFDIQRSD
ncbi:sulfotransferase family protein [Solemya pervernicosa gill symbiont]|uniref:Sulfotransferase family protein n=2 Tax=Solemya pervernicosa gill symbiont TaxID=642797 RepID=A0A1T2L5P0_9GAMM|nr:sulfotransferase family protein [Solemya pervernicosa gill symbiont]